MGYMSRRGRRPNEFASKSAHSHVISDPAVQSFLSACNLPKQAADVTFPEEQLVPFVPIAKNPVRHVIAVDGGFTEVAVRSEFPSATIAFFQFGALIFAVEDLETLEEQPFIDPDDMAKLKKIQRLKLTLPIKNITHHQEATLTHSIRRALHTFFLQSIDGDRLLDTLRWLVFEEYHTSVPTWTLASCPHCDARSIELYHIALTKDGTCPCPQCGKTIFLIDIFRLHEGIDDELGAGGILGYVSTTLEQLVLAHLIRLILRTKPGLLQKILFIKDGPLAFFGQAANMHKPMRTLISFLLDTHTLYLAGLEKSGMFVDHADEIAARLDPGSALILDNDYIYTYILSGKADPASPYGRTTYYGNKLIFKTQFGQMYVVTIPTTQALVSPAPGDLPNLMVVLTNVEKLRCDMYDNALVPVALANKLVSLANHPSSRILQKFAIGAVH